MSNTCKIYFTFVLLSIGLLSCSESIVESTPSIDEDNKQIIASSTFSDIQKNIFDQSCAFSGCHSSGSVNPELSGNSYENIVNMPSSTGMVYINPNSPNESYILQKILGSDMINGSRMPLNSSPLSQENIDAIIEWINDGAKNN